MAKLNTKILGSLLLLLLTPCLRGQVINEQNFQTILISGSGRPINANTAVCTLGLQTTASSISGNVATLTFGSNPQTAGYLRGSLLTVSLFTGTDTIFNGTFPIAAVSSTTISYFLVHAPATASSVGLAFQTGTQGNPCAPLATIFTDYSGATQAANPGTSGPLGNVSIWAPSGVYNLQYYGLGIVTKVIAFSIGGTGGGGSGSPNLQVSFANVTSATLNASSLNTDNLLFQCYDASAPNANPIEANASLNLSTLVITFGFTVSQSGFCAVNGSGGGGGSGPSVGSVLLNPIISQVVTQPPGTIFSAVGGFIAASPCAIDGLIYVSSGGCYTTVQAAINALPGSGGTVNVPPGTYAGPTSIPNSNTTLQCATWLGCTFTYSSARTFGPSGSVINNVSIDGIIFDFGSTNNGLTLQNFAESTFRFQVQNTGTAAGLTLLAPNNLAGVDFVRNSFPWIRISNAGLGMVLNGDANIGSCGGGQLVGGAVFDNTFGRVYMNNITGAYGMQFTSGADSMDFQQVFIDLDPANTTGTALGLNTRCPNNFADVSFIHFSHLTLEYSGSIGAYTGTLLVAGVSSSHFDNLTFSNANTNRLTSIAAGANFVANLIDGNPLGVVGSPVYANVQPVYSVNLVPSTSGANQYAPSYSWQSNLWNGSANAQSTWFVAPTGLPSGQTSFETLIFGNAGSPNTNGYAGLGVQVPNRLIIQSATNPGVLTHANTAQRVWTFPDLTGTVALTGNAGISAGSITMSGGTGSHSFTVAYPGAPSCIATDGTSAAAVKVTSTTGTVTVTGTGTDVVTWICYPATN